MHDVAVVDASPLILLSRVVRLGFLRVAASRIVVPEPVLTELRAKGEDDATVRAVVCAPWIDVVGCGAAEISPDLARMGAGEASVLQLAGRFGTAAAVVDEAAARRRAIALGIPNFGTVGVVVRARRAGMIPLIRPVLDELVAAGMRVSRSVLADVLRRMGE